MLLDHLAGVIYFLLALLLIAGSNLLFLRRLGRLPEPLSSPRVSILVPAREEEANIYACITSLLAQDYPDFQIIALDDHSTDRTQELLESLSEHNPRLSILNGKSLPPGWLGKHWACQQLGEAADGDILLFTDADTRHAPQALSQAVAALQLEKAGLLSALVRQDVVSWAERLAVPVMNWSMLSIFPFLLAHTIRLPVFALANGQFMCFRREAYEQIGGHAAIRADPVDDIALARRAVVSGIRWRMADATRVVSCRMYHDRKQVVEGFSKNLYPTFGRILPIYLFVWIWMVLIFVEPLVIAGLGLVDRLLDLPNLTVTPTLFYAALAAIGLALLQWLLVYWRLRFPIWLSFFYPVSVVNFASLAFRSWIIHWRGKATWKGRSIQGK